MSLSSAINAKFLRIVLLISFSSLLSFSLLILAIVLLNIFA